jgi:hypothetical protein
MLSEKLERTVLIELSIVTTSSTGTSAFSTTSGTALTGAAEAAGLGEVEDFLVGLEAEALVVFFEEVFAAAVIVLYTIQVSSF